MKLSVKAHPKAKKVRVIQTDAAHLEVWVREAADKGRANEAIVEAGSEYFQIAKSRVRVLRGEKSKNKIIEVGNL